MNPNSLTLGPKSWDKSTAINKYSDFVTKMHSLDLAVHPYTLKNDSLMYRENAFLETQLYVDNGIDGVYTEYPHTTLELFTGFGSKAAWPPVTPAIFDQK
jgi:glycerophosphoryl diester phosphodiesterase